MTHYDKLIDAIKSQLYAYYIQGTGLEEWEEDEAELSAESILQFVEEFQQERANLKSTQWRASD